MGSNAPTPPAHSEIPQQSQRPTMAEAQCPAPLHRCSSFTGAVPRESTLGSGPVTAPLHGLAVPSLFPAQWHQSCARQLLPPWISQHPETAGQDPAPHCTLQSWVGGCQLLTFPRVSHRSPGPKQHHLGITTLLCQAHGASCPTACLFNPTQRPQCPMAACTPLLAPCTLARPHPRAMSLLPGKPACPTVPRWGNHNPESLF